MRTNLNGCFVASTMGTPLIVTAPFAEDRVLRHVVTESKDYDKIPSFFFFPVRMGGFTCTVLTLPSTTKP